MLKEGLPFESKEGGVEMYPRQKKTRTAGSVMWLSGKAYGFGKEGIRTGRMLGRPKELGHSYRDSLGQVREEFRFFLLRATEIYSGIS